MRTRLLDISKSNALVSFRHSERSRSHVRIVAASVDGIYDAIAGGQTLKLESLPPRDDEPADERTEEFAARLDAARLSDEEWERDISAIQEGADDEHAKVARAERRLRDRVRQSMGLPPRERAAVSAADHARRHGIDPDFELPGEGEPPSRLQTLLFPDVHERKLSGVREAARSAMDDLGVNTLYTAFGFLEWYESADSDRPLIAPLLILPVSMDRKLHYTSYVYTLSGVDGELAVNVSLSERLNNDWNFVLPSLEEDETPEAYFRRVEAVVTRHDRRWRVRRFVTVGHFAFARIAMYNDLDPARWPAQSPIEGNELIASLLGGGTAGAAGGTAFAKEHDVESEQAERLVPLLVTDADSSQHSAIMDALSGKSLVIEGPPGTGKSQTITNLIAAALAVGKTVLFVAEKMPALQVVKSRLDAAGLGEFCLELHSGKTKRRDVVESLDERLSIQARKPDTRRLSASLDELKTVRSRLSLYVSALNEPLGNGMTGHDALWGDRWRRVDEDAETARRLDELSLPGIVSADADRIRMLKGLLASFEETMAGAGEDNPWTGIGNADLSPAEVEPSARWAGEIADLLGAIAALAGALERYGFTDGMILARTRNLAEAVARVAAVPLRTRDDLAGLADEGRLAAIETWIAAFDRDRAARRRLAAAGIGGPETPSLAEVTAGEAARLAREIEGALNGLVRWHPEIGALEDLPAAVEAAQRASEALATTIALIARAEALVPGVGSLGPATVGIVLELAAGIEPELAHASVEMADAAAPEQIAEASDRAARLREAEAALSNSVSMTGTLDAAALRLHAAALEGAGFLGFLKPSVRAANAFWRGIAKSPSDAPASVLRRLADHLDAVARFENDEDHRAAFGRRWRGLQTDFERASRVASWAKAVRNGFDRTNPAAARVRSDLLRMDVEFLEDLAALARQPGAVDLRALPRGGSGSGGDDLAAVAVQYAACLRDTAALRGRLEAAGVMRGTVAEIRAVAADLSIVAGAGDALNDVGVGSFCKDAQGRPDGDKAEEVLHFGRFLLGSGLSASAVETVLREGVDALRREAAPAAALLLERLNTFRSAWGGFASSLRIDARLFCGVANADDAVPVDLMARLRQVVGEPLALAAWTRHLSARRRAAAEGLEDICLLREESARWRDLPAILERAWYRTLAAGVFRRHPVLSSFDGTSQEEARTRFRELDRRIMGLQREALRAGLADVAIPGGNNWGKKSEYTELALIEHETTKKQRHVPVRKLVSQARNALMAMKPCFMMSPLTVAQYLPRTGMRFDLVVIDEASQMKPEDAMGAMARARQAIVVGDPQQLPPSKFFSSSTASSEDDEEDDTGNLESVLDLGMATFRPARRLRWHYRSRHGSLIAFSNRYFYDDDLIVFPSPAEHMEGAGVTTRFVEEGVYRNRTNLPEAQVVCAEALAFIAANPKRSLGIVAINAVQAQLIRDEMDRIFTEHPEAEEWRRSWDGTLEPFFVKNLENVQGDERDAIFISTVYGRTADGKQVSNMFGEIVRAAGHRRLNVLFTRAKHAVRLFTSLRPEDVRVTPTSSRGLVMFHEYLRFAASGRIEGGRETGLEPDSDFEVMVAEMLRAKGFDVVPQVGVSGFRIDLAVKDPDVPGGFLAGIECDGASYHSSKSARDRDRLRQEVLEGLGWTLYRIWSTDWYRDPRSEAEKAASFLGHLRRTRVIPDHAAFRPSVSPAAPATAAATGGTRPRPSMQEVLDVFTGDLLDPLRGTTAAPAAARPPRGASERLAELAARIDEEVGEVQPDRHILRPEMVDVFVRSMPESPSEFRNVVPLKMRERIDPRHMKWLDEIFETLAD